MKISTLFIKPPSSSISSYRPRDGKINHTDFTFSCSSHSLICRFLYVRPFSIECKTKVKKENFGSSKKKCFRWHFSTSMRLLVMAKFLWIETLIYILNICIIYKKSKPSNWSSRWRREANLSFFRLAFLIIFLMNANCKLKFEWGQKEILAHHDLITS